MKFSILSFVFGDYESIREPNDYDPEIEYVLVTDNKSVKSDIWNIKCVPDFLQDSSAFTKSFYVRYHPFEFVSNNVVLVIDGSIQILKTPSKLIDDFIKSNKDICLSVHSLANPLYKEFDYFVNQRNYSKTQCIKNIAMTKVLGYTENYKGYFEANIKICKNDLRTNVINDFIWNCLIKISETPSNIDRLDQTIMSAVINFQSDLSIFPISRQAIKSNYMMWMEHGKNIPKDKSITPKKLWLKNTLADMYQLL